MRGDSAQKLPLLCAPQNPPATSTVSHSHPINPSVVPQTRIPASHRIPQGHFSSAVIEAAQHRMDTGAKKWDREHGTQKCTEGAWFWGSARSHQTHSGEMLDLRMGSPRDPGSGVGSAGNPSAGGLSSRQHSVARQRLIGLPGINGLLVPAPPRLRHLLPARASGGGSGAAGGGRVIHQPHGLWIIWCAGHRAVKGRGTLEGTPRSPGAGATLQRGGSPWVPGRGVCNQG